jgi:hypothetical protein
MNENRLGEIVESLHELEFKIVYKLKDEARPAGNALRDLVGDLFDTKMDLIGKDSRYNVVNSQLEIFTTIKKSRERIKVAIESSISKRSLRPIRKLLDIDVSNKYFDDEPVRSVINIKSVSHKPLSGLMEEIVLAVLGLDPEGVALNMMMKYCQAY